MKLPILLIGIILLISSVSALSITVENITSTSIQWSWDVAPIANISINGVYVCDLDPNAHKLTLSDLKEEEYHTIIVYENETSNATSTVQTNKSSSAKIIDFIFAYLLVIAAIICILAGTKLPILAWLGAGLSIVGVTTTILESFWAGFIFMVLFSAAVIVAFSGD
jgi:hypothetical protein